MDGWINGLLHAVVQAVAAATDGALNWVLDMLAATIFSTPDVTALPQVAAASGQAQLVANGLLVLIVMVVGMLAMTHGSVQDRYTLKELAPRMLLGFLAANMGAPLVRAVIVAANALTSALAGGTFTSVDTFVQVQRVILGAVTDPALFLAAIVLRTVALWMLILVMVTWLGRVTLLLVVAAVAPIALLCHALPQTEAVARLWWRALLGALVVQVLQAVTLHLAVITLLDNDANLAGSGILPHDPTDLFDMLVTCFVLWQVIRIPKWVAKSLGSNSGRGASLLGSIVRVVVVQQLLGAIGLRGGSRLLAGRRGSLGPRPPATHLHQHLHNGTHEHLHLHPPRPPNRPPRPGSPGSDVPPTMRVPSWREPPARPHPGRPPRALEAQRPAPPPAARRALGPA